jgi:hypothetical protein
MEMRIHQAGTEVALAAAEGGSDNAVEGVTSTTPGKSQFGRWSFGIILLSCASDHVNASTPRDFPGVAHFHGWNRNLAMSVKIGEPLYATPAQQFDCSAPAADYNNSPTTGMAGLGKNLVQVFAT